MREEKEKELKGKADERENAKKWRKIRYNIVLLEITTIKQLFMLSLFTRITTLTLYLVTDIIFVNATVMMAIKVLLKKKDIRIFTSLFRILFIKDVNISEQPTFKKKKK